MSKARSTASSVMQVWVSVTQIETYWPRSRSRWRAARSSSHLFAVSTVMRPPLQGFPAQRRAAVGGRAEKLESLPLEPLFVAQFLGSRHPG
jgi:hypothetical protein